MASINRGKGTQYSGAGRHGDRRLKRLNTRRAVEDEALDEYEDVLFDNASVEEEEGCEEAASEDR